MNGKVLVVTPVYSTKENGRLPLLKQAISCVQNQTYSDFVHLIVDDGSTDETPKFLDELSEKDKRINVFHKPNGGSSSAINYGVEKAFSGGNYQYITITHSDDLLPRKSLELRVNQMEGDKSKFLYSDSVIFNDFLRRYSLQLARNFPNAEALFLGLKNLRIPYSTMFWNFRFFVDKVGGYDSRMKSLEDWDIAIRSAKKVLESNAKFSVVSKITSAYRIHEKNLAFENISNGIRWECCKLIYEKYSDNFVNYSKSLLKGRIKLFAKKNLPPEVILHLKNFRSFLLKLPKEELIPFEGNFIDLIHSGNF